MVICMNKDCGLPKKKANKLHPYWGKPETKLDIRIREDMEREIGKPKKKKVKKSDTCPTCGQNK